MRGRIRATSLRLARPHLHLALDSRRAGARDSSTIAAGAAEPRGTSFHLQLARQLPSMKIGNLRIDSAAFSWERRVSNRVERDSVGNIHVVLQDIDTDSASASDPRRVLFSEDVRFSVDAYARLSPTGVYLMSMDTLRGSTREGRLSFRNMQFVPILSDSQLKRKLTWRTSRYRITVSRLELQGIEYRGIFENNTVAVASALLHQPLLDVYSDRTLPARTSRQPVVLPHEALRAWSWNLRMDTIRMEHGRILYSERAPDGARPGTIRFEQFAGEFRNVANVFATDAAPTRVDIRARLNGAGELRAVADYDMSADKLNMTFRGSLSRMDAASFNEILTDLEGVRVLSGRIDTAWFETRVVNDSASGRVHFGYGDLRVSFQDKDTGRRGLLDVIKTFVANAMKLKSANPDRPGAPARTASVELRRRPEVPIVGFMWHIVRAGLMTTLGI
jgi:hypothetical protein